MCNLKVTTHIDILETNQKRPCGIIFLHQQCHEYAMYAGYMSKILLIKLDKYYRNRWKTLGMLYHHVYGTKEDLSDA